MYLVAIFRPLRTIFQTSLLAITPVWFCQAVAFFRSSSPGSKEIKRWTTSANWRGFPICEPLLLTHSQGLLADPWLHNWGHITGVTSTLFFIAWLLEAWSESIRDTTDTLELRYLSLGTFQNISDLKVYFSTFFFLFTFHRKTWKKAVGISE